MTSARLHELIAETFALLSCPLSGVGLHAELERALKAAYDLGLECQHREALSAMSGDPSALNLEAVAPGMN